MVKELNEAYDLKKNRIKKRLDEFKLFYTDNVSWFYINNEISLQKVNKTDNQRLFEELVFCLLTANTSAEMSIKAVDNVRVALEKGSLDDIKKKLKKSGYRFPNKRAEYIIEARKKEFDLKALIETKDKQALRDFLVINVRGFGYKESSHFLRNVGVFGLAILDKHILRSLLEYDVITDIPKTLNKNKYLKIEQKLIEFSKDININMDELDLLLWSMKTNRIMK